MRRLRPPIRTRAVADLSIRSVAVDTGRQHAKAAYEYCRNRPTEPRE
jgi:hypothetical protein